MCVWRVFASKRFDLIKVSLHLWKRTKIEKKKNGDDITKPFAHTAVVCTIDDDLKWFLPGSRNYENTPCSHLPNSVILQSLTANGARKKATNANKSMRKKRS